MMARKLILYIGIDSSSKIRIDIYDESRISYHGFGTFLVNFKPKEIGISKEAKNALLKCKCLSGRGVKLEFSSKNVMSWRSKLFELSVPLENVSVSPDTKEVIKKFFVL